MSKLNTLFLLQPAVEAPGKNSIVMGVVISLRSALS